MDAEPTPVVPTVDQAWERMPSAAGLLQANRKLRFRDFVGRRARVAVALVTRGGDRFPEGTLVVIDHTYRGRFSLTAVEPRADGRPRCICRVHPGRIVPIETIIPSTPAAASRQGG